MKNLKSIAAQLSKTIDAELFELCDGVSAFFIKTELWAFLDYKRAKSFDELSKDQGIRSISLPSETTIVRFVIDEERSSGRERVSLGLGYEGITLKSAMHKILDLPDTFQESQSKLLDSALLPVSGLPGGIVKMRTIASDQANYLPETEDALEALLAWVGAAQSKDGCKNLLFIEAEAGKGKTILLATAANFINENYSDKLAIYIPLRNLPLTTGVGWESISQLIGAVGLGAERLARAVKNGLVVLFLDGIDEVSGRYDRSLIKDLLELLSLKLSSLNSMVVLSGRKTEAKSLEGNNWDVLGLELPEAESSEFARYVSFVIDSLIADWDDAVNNVPDEFSELLGKAFIDGQVRREKAEISQWITSVFPVVGKDASLFFVQGLAAIAIGRRAGNRLPLSTGGTPVVPTLVDVCNAAAVFACLREQTKIDGIAKTEYTASKQMELLAGFSLLSSSINSKLLPTPNELTALIFDVNTINESETYVAITRQNAKHALLYAAEAVGNYQPHFLSDWIRCSFIAQALKSNLAVGNVSSEQTRAIIASADRSRYVFSSFLPDMLLDAEAPSEWIESLISEIENQSETASANLWQLRAAIGDDRVGRSIPNPLPLSQIDQAEFVGNQIGSEFSGESYFLDGSTFDSVDIHGAVLSGVSMLGVKFRDCTLNDVIFRHQCEGPIYFERCTLEAVFIENIVSSVSPALTFIDCTFKGFANSIVQDRPAFGETRAEPAICFRGCVIDAPSTDLIKGDWIQVKNPPEGLEQHTAEDVDPAVECLREIFNTFFPSRMGSGQDIQARRYIRLSALGRGRMPLGSPGPDVLKSILESIGFADGGRPDHLYAPWSSILGGNESDRRIREEIIDFLLNNNFNGPVMDGLLKRVRRYF